MNQSILILFRVSSPYSGGRDYRTLHRFTTNYTNIFINSTRIVGDVRHINGRNTTKNIVHRCHGVNYIFSFTRFYKGTIPFILLCTPT